MQDLISRQAAIDAICKDCEYYYNENVVQDIKDLPSAYPEIVTCKDCKHRGEAPIADGRFWCEIHDTFMYYCSDVERREDDQKRSD